ncbi:hypothetical protein CSIM01_03465 [Colletotrichum simmondsii]|uniref:Uncharacterized protein n=1 Tax=Colletotrichum simmondsii TaxID=703756 RepID=A0A135RYR6_9PEZI|nr:hypothetical protein CSIM01_03465 [Colletotrichum simmondsii]
MAGVLFVPMKVDAFILNESICTSHESNQAKIAPITQPNYTFLRYDTKYLAADVLRHTDIHASGDPKTNPRFTNLGTGDPIQGRQGVYIHWSMPRSYRSGRPASPQSAGGTPSSPSVPPTKEPAPTPFSPVPTRWIVIRHCELEEINDSVPPLAAWVVESDHCQMIDQLDDSTDLQTDVSPFIAAATQTTGVGKEIVDTVDIDKQAEVFIGSKSNAETWTSTESKKRSRINIDLTKSSNQLFPDFQPHNTNVFSMIDDLRIGDELQRIQKAKLSYYVLGFHRDSKQDPLASPGAYGTRDALLKALNMEVMGAESNGSLRTWLDLPDAASTICHGAKYDVEWDVSSRPKVVADELCAKLMKDKSVSVGVTPLDSIMAHVHDQAANGAPEFEQVYKDILQMEKLLIAQDEDVEAQLRASTLIEDAKFKRQEGGKRFVFANTKDEDQPTGISKPEDQPAQRLPEKEELVDLLALNRDCIVNDTALRLKQSRQWDMFSLWWLFLRDRDSLVLERQPKHERETLRSSIEALGKASEDLKASIPIHGKDSHLIMPPVIGQLSDTQKTRAKLVHTLQGGVAKPFFQPSDPTLMVSCIPSSWPKDFLDNLKVRLNTQCPFDGKMKSLDAPWEKFFDNVLEKCCLPDLALDAKRLVEEFASLQKDRGSWDCPKDTFLPLYHDHEVKSNGEADETRWRDRWNSEQPFFPLYLEWDIEYFHVPYRFWHLNDTTRDGLKPSQARYSLDAKAYLEYRASQKKDDRRTLSGRSLILPQPTFSLESKVRSLFSQLSDTALNEILPEKDRDLLLNSVRQLPYLSAPLTGLTDHLLTRLHGTHVKPNNRPANALSTESVPIAAAVPNDPQKIANFEAWDLKLIEGESDLTPYGSSVELSGSPFAAFKPVTHGQFFIKKLNIIDKFGQVIHAVDPSVSAAKKWTVPSCGEYHTADSIFGGNKSPGSGDDTIVPSEAWVQIPPQINQSSRLNSAFVTLTDPGEGRDLYWRPTNEWENPVWGWVVINYANYGLQFFTGDGKFYRDVRLGGPEGSLASPEWLPFEPPKVDPAKDKHVQYTQLQRLVSEMMKSAGYLRAFIRMLDDSMATLLPAPSGYSEQWGTVTGRPLALVNTGWSLELAVQPYVKQNLRGDLAKEPLILADADSLSRDQANLDGYYDFPVKFGSREKAHDGLVGYFAAKEKTDDGLQVEDGLLLDQIYTYYGHNNQQDKTGEADLQASEKQPLRCLGSKEQRLLPFYFNPMTREATDFDILRCREQTIFGAIMDPFASIHAYTSILPVQELRLPTWIINEAFSDMSVFFSLGPILLPKNIPDLDDKQQQPVGTDPLPSAGQQLSLGVPIPASTLGTWNWLQPYFTSDTPATATDAAIKYTRMKVDKVDERMRFEKSPYTAAEGFLQLTRQR